MNMAFDKQYFDNYCLKEPYNDTLHIHLITFNIISAGYATIFKRSIVESDLWLQRQKILEAGCAMGHVVENLIYNGVDCEGYDISNYAIANTVPLARGKTWCGDHETELPKMQDEQYDIIFANSFQYIKDLEKLAQILCQAYRVCKHSLIFVGVTTEGLYRAITDRKQIWDLQIVQSKKWWENLFKECGFNSIFWSTPVLAFCLKNE
jgi:SAM-dependent methyltransferase